VVSDADGLSDATMQAIARELNNSETAFLLSPTAPDHDVWIRFFTPTIEVPVCGHATIAAHYVRANVKRLPRTVVRHKVGTGIFPIEVLPEDGDYRIVMTQGTPEFGSKIEGEHRAALLRALGLAESGIDARAPIQIVSTGHSKVIISVKSRRDLNAMQPDMGSLAALSRVIGCNGYFPFTFDSDDQAILTYSRMFAPAIGINEDPVTGNGYGPLGAYLVKYALTNHSPTLLAFIGRQGERVRRPGQVQVEVDIDGPQPVGVRIAGNAVIAFQSTLSL
jgi:PhzF family phenazine biosynthesis protein